MSAIAQILTVGHSTHEPEAFLDLLRGARIELLADVRRFPGSRRMPWFSAEALRSSLSAAEIGYIHMSVLGGRRDPLAGSPNGGWRIAQFHGYADHMRSPEFTAALERLLELGRKRRTAVMCAEAQWRQCHRRLLSDALIARGWEVIHVGRGGATEPHTLTEFAVVDGERVSYPPAQATLDL